MEPTVNGSTEEAEGSSITPKNQPEPEPCQSDDENKSKLDSIKGKIDDEEDEGVAQSIFIEDGESMHSASETEKRGAKPTTQERMETRDAATKGTEELIGDLRHTRSRVPLDLNGELSLTQASEVHGTSSLKRQSPDRPTSAGQTSETNRRRKSYEAELKLWLLEKIQAPIEGTDFMVVSSVPASERKLTLFVFFIPLPIDMLYSSEEKSKNPPMFLCFKVGKPMRKSFTSGLTSSPIHSFGGRGKQPEYWFAVPQER